MCEGPDHPASWFGGEPIPEKQGYTSARIRNDCTSEEVVNECKYIWLNGSSKEKAAEIVADWQDNSVRQSVFQRHTTNHYPCSQASHSVRIEFRVKEGLFLLLDELTEENQ